MATVGFSSLDEVRFLQGSTLSGVPMALEFKAISINEATQIRDHYLEQRQHRSFALPAAIWRTHSSQFNVVPAASVWRYAGQPQESPRPGELVDVTVSLISAFDPTVARIVSGGTFAQFPILSAGSLAGYTLVSGGTFTQTPTLAPGAAGALGAPAPMLSFTSGTPLAWSRANTMYGFSFTLTSAKEIKGIGAYDAGGDGLQNQVQMVVYENPGIYIPESGITIRNNVGEFPGIYPSIPAGTAAPLDGVWRRVDFGNNGATLQPGTYGAFIFLSGNTATSNITMIKNATGLTTLAGVTINGPLAYDLGEGEAISTTGDSFGYFGPVLFF